MRGFANKARVRVIRAIDLVGVYARRRFRGMWHYVRARAASPPLCEKTVLFEAYRGSKIADNPYAMFRQMIEDPFYKEFTFIWAIDGPSDPKRQELSRLPRVRFCRIHSRSYARALCTAKYLVNNKAWPAYFSKRPGQVHVTTWHATAFKTLGKHQGGTIGQLRNLARNILHADFLVMPNRFTSRIMLDSSDVDGIFPGTVLEVGYPRVDLTVNTPRATAEDLLAAYCGIDPSKKVVLYAPTWRGETGDYLDTTDASIAHIRELRSALPDGYELLLKVHDLTYTYLGGRADAADLTYVPDWLDTNELLPAVDVLVTDYSSIFFDFMVLDRPVIFFAYDLDEYVVDRGLYFDMEDLPGPLCRTAGEAAAAVADAEASRERYARRYEEMRQEYCGSEDGRSAERVCDAVFKGAAPDVGYRSFDDSRTRVLVLGCPFDHSPQTFELIGLSRSIDYDTYDLTVLFTAKVTRERQRLVSMLDPRTRVRYGEGQWALTPTGYWALGEHESKPAAQRCEPHQVERVRGFFEAELQRLVGDTHFDVGLCLTDKLTSWTYLLSVCEFDSRIMWLVESTPRADERLPAGFVLERFDEVRYEPDLAGSRFVRDAGEHMRSGAPVRASLRSGPERFIGFDWSVEGMRDRYLLQTGLRIAHVAGAAASGGRGPGCSSGKRKVLDAAEAAVSEVTEAISQWLAEREHECGLDHRKHNLTVVGELSAAFDRTGGGDASDGLSQKGGSL